MPEQIIPIAISACLLGEEVRYDGKHKQQTWIHAMADVRWIPICPEVEAGMGVPREKIHLELHHQHLKLMSIDTRQDWSAVMDEQASVWIAKLQQQNVSGYIFKSKSPSCGIKDVPIWQEGRSEPVAAGRGRFVQRVTQQWPELPLVDEMALQDETGRQRFMQQVREYHFGSS